MSSKRHQRQKTCESKDRYPTKEAANNAMLSAMARGVFDGYGRAYRCPFAGQFPHYHYGHIKLTHRIDARNRRSA